MGWKVFAVSENPASAGRSAGCTDAGAWSEQRADLEKQESGETILTVPQNTRVWKITQMMAKWMNAPTERRVELDEVGGFVWELCDGHHTVETIVQKTGKHYKMNRREAEVSVTMFLQMLHERNFIGFYKKSNMKSSKGN